MKIVAIVLTHNEEKHIARCLANLQQVTSDILVVDSFSTDRTEEIAFSYGAKILKRKWLNYADQFAWAMSQIDSDASWVMRVDADEYLSDEFIHEIKTRLISLDAEIVGVYCKLGRVFQGGVIRYGAVSIKMLRLWRYGYGTMEVRWMDEHIRLNGKAITFKGEIIDHNLNSIGWWVTKHNAYASREVLDILYHKYALNDTDKLSLKSPFGLKRWVKEHIYNKLPRGLRAFMYFVYRYIFAGGFIDGRAGFAFHFLQGYWYRFLVDTKLAEVERSLKLGVSFNEAVDKILDIKR